MTHTIHTLACLAIIAGALPAQRMGHANSKAPELAQSITLAEHATIKLGYTSITWASGNWEKALQNPERRETLRERINAAATESPLGRFETEVALMLGKQHLHKGTYDLAFTLNEKFAWQLVVRSDHHSITTPLQFSDRSNPSTRLILNLNAGDEDETGVLAIAFGDKECELAIVPHLSDEPVKPAKQLVNSMCPLMDEAVDPEVTVTHKGKTIGLCCEDCIEEWNELSTAKQDEHLAKMTKKQ